MFGGPIMIKMMLISIFTLIFSTPSFAKFHEVELHSTEALLTFSEGNSINIEGNYLLYLNKDWQILFGGEYEQYDDFLTRSGIAIGAVYNFGAVDHNQKYYVKPQFNYVMTEALGDGENALFISGVIGRRFPLYKGSYTLNYTPSIGISIPVTNTDYYDPIVSVSIVGLSLVFD